LYTPPAHSIVSYSKIDYKGTIYKIGDYITSFKSIIYLYEILEIVIVHKNDINCIVHEIQLNSYDSHLRAYNVNKDKNIVSKCLISVKELCGPPININKITNGELMIKLKEYY